MKKRLVKRKARVTLKSRYETAVGQIKKEMEESRATMERLCYDAIGSAKKKADEFLASQVKSSKEKMDDIVCRAENFMYSCQRQEAKCAEIASRLKKWGPELEPQHIMEQVERLQTWLPEKMIPRSRRAIGIAKLTCDRLSIPMSLPMAVCMLAIVEATDGTAPGS